MKRQNVNEPSAFEERRTCCGDVVKLLSSYGSKDGYSFSLYKTLELADTSRKTTGNWIYFIISEQYKYPIVITQECAESIMEEPIKGIALVFND